MKPIITNGKMDFFGVFDETFDSEKMYRLDEQVEVKIRCVKFDKLDKQILSTLLNESSKRIDGNEVTCRIETKILIKRVGLSETDLQYRIRKLLSLGLNEYTPIAEAQYSFCVIKTLSENGKQVEYEVTFMHLPVLKRLFEESFIELLTGGADEGPSGTHKLVANGKELFFLNYGQAFDYGKQELLPQKIDYHIYQISTNELVYAYEHLYSNRKEMNMNTRLPQVNKLDFMDLFNLEFPKGNIPIGIDEDVIVTFDCPAFTLVDRMVFETIWSYGEKCKVDDSIVSTINETPLFSIIQAKDGLENILGRLSRLAIAVKYSFEGEHREYRINIFDLAIASDIEGNLKVVTMEIKSLEVLNWLFSEESLEKIGVKVG